MVKHLDFLGVLYLIWGGFGLLVGGASLSLAIGATLIMTTVTAAEEGATLAAAMTAATFAILGFASLAWGTIHVATGRGLRRRRPVSRQAALGLGAVNLLLLPFGTALGVYALWVLLHEESRRLLQAVRV